MLPGVEVLDLERTDSYFSAQRPDIPKKHAFLLIMSNHRA